MKNTTRSLIATFFLGWFALSTQAQIARTSVVEHFTNTSCVICANNNEGYYDIIHNYPGTLHISFHPSAPYSNDFFNQQNQAENDARANFYDVFGSTPRLVVNGLDINNSTLNNKLSSAVNATSNFEVKVLQEQTANSQFNVRVVIKKVATDNLTNALLFVGVSEDTVYQSTNNGESVHYNVFRKVLSNINGSVVTLPSDIGDSTVTNYNYTATNNWNPSRLHSIGILQRTDKTLINAATSTNSSLVPTSVFSLDDEPFNIYPNPSNSGFITLNLAAEELQLFNLSGQRVMSFGNISENSTIDTRNLQSGMYLMRLKKDNCYLLTKLIIQ